MTGVHRLDGRKVLITGASGHLGTAMARAVSELGGEPILNGRHPDALQPLSAELGAEVLVFDAGDPEEIRPALQGLDRLDGIVLGAYEGRVGPIETIERQDFELAFRMNLLGPFELVRAAVPLLQRPGTGRESSSVVAIGSMYGVVSPDPRMYGQTGVNNPVHYGATKAGLIQMARYLAVHLAPRGIRVNSVSPGPFPSPNFRETSPSLYSALCDKVPMGRIGEPDEIADVVTFLLSAASSYITGANLPVDGGWTAW